MALRKIVVHADNATLEIPEVVGYDKPVLFIEGVRVLVNDPSTLDDLRDILNKVWGKRGKA